MSAELTREMIEEVAVWLDWDYEISIFEQINRSPGSVLENCLEKLAKKNIKFEIVHNKDDIFYINFEDMKNVDYEKHSSTAKTLFVCIILEIWHYIQHTQSVPNPK